MKAFYYILTALAGIAIGVLLMWLLRKPISTEPIVIHDTIAVHDSLRIAEHTKPLYVIKWDTLYTEKPASPDIARDSLCDGYVTDSAAVEIPIMAYEYRDTFSTDSSRTELAVHFSGYNAKIDSIDLMQDWTIQPRVGKEKRGFGHFAGFAIGPSASLVWNPITGRFEWGVGVSATISLYGFGFHY